METIQAHTSVEGNQKINGCLTGAHRLDDMKSEKVPIHVAGCCTPVQINDN
jgi:hypothetical protein